MKLRPSLTTGRVRYSLCTLLCLKFTHISLRIPRWCNTSLIRALDILYSRLLRTNAGYIQDLRREQERLVAAAAISEGGGGGGAEKAKGGGEGNDVPLRLLRSVDGSRNGAEQEEKQKQPAQQKQPQLPFGDNVYEAIKYTDGLMKARLLSFESGFLGGSVFFKSVMEEASNLHISFVERVVVYDHRFFHSEFYLEVETSLKRVGECGGKEQSTVLRIRLWRIRICLIFCFVFLGTGGRDRTP